MNECDIEYPPCECDEPMESSLPAGMGMEMRPMEPRDLDEVKRLHEQCFPVRYDMAFYENVVRGFIARGKGNAREPLYTQVAVVPSTADPLPVRAGNSGGDGGGGDLSCATNANHDSASAEGAPMDVDDEGRPAPAAGDNGDGEEPQRYSPHGVEIGGSSTLRMVGGGSGSVGDAGAGAIYPPLGADGGAGQETGESIVGLITCQVMPVDRCRDQDRLGLGRGGSAHSEVVYILTLGTEMRYRRQGIGRALLRRCVWLSRQEPSIGAVYLHVITTNPPAHRFYESEGFVQVCEISDYYRINGQLYDCFLYALFVNGAQPPGEWGWGIQSLSRRLRSIISFFRRTLGHVPEEGKLAAAVVAAAAAGGPSSQETGETQGRRRQGGDPEEMEPDEEQPRPPPPPLPRPPTPGDVAGGSPDQDRARSHSAFAAAAAAAGAAAAAARRRGSETTGNAAAAAAAAAAGAASASAPASPGAPTRYPGRGFACSQQEARQSCSAAAMPKHRHQCGGGAGDDHLDEGRGNGVAASSRSGDGVPPPTVTLWDAAATGVGALGKGGGFGVRRGVEVASQEGVEVIEVGSGVVDVSPYPGDGRGGGGDNGGRHWGGRLGHERV